MELTVTCTKCGAHVGTACSVSGGAHAERINSARDYWRNAGKMQARRELATAR